MYSSPEETLASLLWPFSVIPIFATVLTQAGVAIFACTRRRSPGCRPLALRKFRRGFIDPQPAAAQAVL